MGEGRNLEMEDGIGNTKMEAPSNYRIGLGEFIADHADVGLSN